LVLALFSVYSSPSVSSAALFFFVFVFGFCWPAVKSVLAIDPSWEIIISVSLFPVLASNIELMMFLSQEPA
jgi:hypothetical protein